MIKIETVVYRFFEDDRLYTENNETENLIAVKSKADYENYNIQLKNIEFPLMKSIPLTYPTCMLSQGWEERSDDSDDYRINSKMWYYCYQGYNFNLGEVIIGNKFIVQHALTERFLGIFWRDYDDELYYLVHDLEFGGNCISSASWCYSTHDFYSEHHTYPPTQTSSSKNHHYIYYGYQDFGDGYALDSFNPPAFQEGSFQYWTNKITTRYWMTIHN